MSSSSASSASPQRKLSNLRDSGSSSSSASSTGTQPAMATTKPRQPVSYMLNANLPRDPEFMDTQRALRLQWKRCLFDNNTTVDWKSIPTFEEAENGEYTNEALQRNPALRCETSRRYRDQVIAKYRKPLYIDFKFDGEHLSDVSAISDDDDSDFVDMIG